MRNPLKNIGPGALIAAAFIGPGTVTVCTLAGVQFGYGLLWALTLSIVATIVLQETAARIGLVTGKGLSQVLRNAFTNPVARNAILILVLAAIVIGNAAYEAGNLSGAVLGMEVFYAGDLQIAGLNLNIWSLIIGVFAFVALYLGNYKILEKLFLVLIILMSLSFIITAIITKPDIVEFFKGAFIPSIPTGGILMVMALIGTTVVPYNLFLHASLVNQKWSGEGDLAFAKKDTMIAVIVGGIVSMCVVLAATSINAKSIANVSDMAVGLEPLYGSLAKYSMATGMFAAGLTSSITAPLAAAFVAQGCLGLSEDQKSWKFRAVWMTILVLGIVFSTFGFKPIEVIKFAQVANGMLLPIIAGILIWLANQKAILGNKTNTKTQNILSALILIITIALGVIGISKGFS